MPGLLFEQQFLRLRFGFRFRLRVPTRLRLRVGLERTTMLERSQLDILNLVLNLILSINSINFSLSATH